VLTAHDSLPDRPLLYCGADYSFYLKSKMNNTCTGLMIELGLNVLARNSDKMFLGPFIGIKSVRTIWNYNYKSDFTETVNEHFILSQPTYADTLYALAYKGGVNHTDSVGNLGGCNYFNYGIAFRLNRPYFPLLQLHGTFYSDAISAYRYNYNYFRKEADWIHVYFNKAFGARLAFPLDKKTEPGHFTITFSWMHILLRSGDVGGVKLTSILQPGFFEKYGSEDKFGISLGVKLF
jgi:hypothetical protein